MPKSAKPKKVKCSVDVGEKPETLHSPLLLEQKLREDLEQGTRDFLALLRAEQRPLTRTCDDYLTFLKERHARRQPAAAQGR